MQLALRVGSENPAAVEALRILARLLVADARKRLALHPDRPLSVPRGVAS
jgi:hypothetical protein